MPTENRSSNTDMVSVKRELADRALERLDRAESGFPGSVPFLKELREALVQPTQRHQGEPVALAIPDECPHIIVFDDADRANEHFCGAGARPAALRRFEQVSQSWNAHLFARIARNSRDDQYPSATVADPAEVERLREQARSNVRWQAVANEQKSIIETLRAQLADANAALNAIAKESLSASAEPSAPVERQPLVSEEELRDLAASACQSALAHGISEEWFMWLARTVEQCARSSLDLKP